jgi:O-antigen ligase
MPINPVQRIGAGILIFYVFGVFSAVLDLIPFVHVLRPMVLTGFIGLCIVLITGSFRRLTRHKIAAFLGLFTAWFVCCIPMSVWPGGAFNVLVGDWQKAIFTFFLAAGLICNHAQYRKVMYALGGAAILLALLALRANTLVDGRLLLDRTRYENPNDLAMILVTALPFIVYMAVRSTSKVAKLVAVGGAIPVLLAIAKTGSRGALIGAGVMLAVFFFQTSIQNKFKVMVATVFAVILAALVLPSELQQRFFTVFGDDPRMINEATVGSTYSRKMLLMDSITLTLHNPIFGVGPGMFPVAQDKLARDRGEPMGNWHVTHNSYTQVSSETGIPGFILFMGVIVCAYQSLRRIERTRYRGNNWDDLRSMAQALRISLWAFCSVSFFSSVAYLAFFPILCGLAVALEYVAQTMLTGEMKMANQRPIAPVRRVPQATALSRV